MSELYEAVLAIGFTSEGARVVEVPPEFHRLSLPGGVIAFLRDLSSGRKLSVVDTRQLASMASVFSESALAVFYDNRIALRAAARFSRGKLVREYDAQDELWVPLDGNGQPVSGAAGLSVGDLAPGQEYETARTAIDAALSAVGLFPSLDSGNLKQQFCYGKCAD